QLLGPGRDLRQALLYQVGDRLGVGLGVEAMPDTFQPIPELAVVRHDPVVNEGEATAAVEMGVRVALGDTAVGRPARVPDADAAARQRRQCFPDLADALVDGYIALARHRDAPGVVAAVFELLQTPQHDVGGLPVPAHITEDPAHYAPVLSRRRTIEAIQRRRERPGSRLPSARGRRPRAPASADARAGSSRRRRRE